MDSLKRVKTLQISVVAVAIVLLLRLFYIQVIDDSYKSNAANNVLRYTVQYPPRGEVYDRNGRFLVQSKEAYDLMAIPREIRPFDTAAMSRILGVSVEQIRKELRKASNFSRRRASVIFKQLPTTMLPKILTTSLQPMPCPVNTTPALIWYPVTLCFMSFLCLHWYTAVFPWISTHRIWNLLWKVFMTVEPGLEILEQ